MEYLFVEMWHYVGGPPSRRSLCFGAKPDKGFGFEILTRPEVGREHQSESWMKGPTEGSWRRATGDGEGQLESTPDSRRDQSVWDRVQMQVRKGQSRLVGIPSIFVEISRRMHVSVSLHMQRNAECHNLTFLHLSWPKPYCSFVLCSFLPFLWLYFLLSWRNVRYPYRNH